ncbi:MAG: AraC family transcriptional regulator [Bacteroidota bacterium]|nr:AraC family transcriptional regulator [Bacteroidota bacterium]
MKLQFEKVPLNNSSLLIKEETFEYFDIPLHNHPEIELSVILEGEGQKIIGNKVSNIETEDLIMTGPWLPHLWKSTSIKKSNVCRQIVIQFLPEFLGKDFIEKQELIAVKRLFQKTNQGIVINGSTKKNVVKLMKEMLQKSDLDRIILLLQILNLIAQSDEYETQSTAGYNFGHNTEDEQRMKEVFTYLLENFKKEIYLDDIAQKVHLTPQAFSRYFKHKTKKTFSSVLSEIRIGHACQLLLAKELSISQISDECGFYNLSNFNRTFKMVTNFSPTMYVSNFG